MARDHSETCEVCGCQRGGFNDYLCSCDFDDDRVLAVLDTLAANLSEAGALCEAYRHGRREAAPTMTAPADEDEAELMKLARRAIEQPDRVSFYETDRLAKALLALAAERDRLRAVIAEHLPHPNGPNATTPGDPDAWNAAMFNLGELRTERDRLRAELLRYSIEAACSGCAEAGGKEGG